MEIRVASAADLPELVSVQREIQDLHVGWNPERYRHATDEELLQGMRELFAAEQTRVWVAWAEGRPVGCLVLKIAAVAENAFCYARIEAVVDQIAVLARFGRQGIGSALMDEAARYAREQGCTELRLDVVAADTAARKFYDALGFSVVHQRMRKEL